MINAKVTPKKPNESLGCIPAGGYVAKILKAEIVKTQKGDEQLLFSFDIIEGEYKDFFANQYKSSTFDNKKWKGTYRVTIPVADSQWFESQQRTLDYTIGALEESNPSYHFDGDELKMKGLTVGVKFRNREYDVDGNQGWTTECGAFTTVEIIRSGDYKPLKDKPLKNKSTSNSNEYAEVPDDGDLPF